MIRALIVLVAACGTTPEPAAPAASGVGLEWSMRVEGDQLRIDYTITNATAARVTVAEALPVKRKPDPERIVVRGDKRADTIAFTRGMVLPESGIRFEVFGAPPVVQYRELAPGAQLQGIARTRLPLGASHNFTGAYAIHGARTAAVLEVEYYDQPDVDASNAASAWRTHGRKALRGAVKPLPPGVTLATPEAQVERSFGNVMLGCPSPCPDPSTPPGASL